MSALDNKEIFSRNLKKYLDLNKQTRKEVSSAIGVRYTTFSDWYNGRSYPRMDKIEKIAEHFGIRKADLVEEKSWTAEDFRFSKEAAEIAQQIFDNPTLLILYKSLIKMDQTELTSLIRILKIKI